MTVDINVTRSDLIRINLFLWPHVKFNWFYLAFLFLVGFAVSMTAWDAEIPLSMSVGFSLAVAFVLAVTVSALTFLLFLIIGVAGASERSGLGRHAYEISDEGLIETTRINQELSKWEAFQKIWHSGRYILLKKHWAAIHIFPSRCFDSPEHFQEFYAALKAKIGG